MKDLVLAILVSSLISYVFATYKSRQAMNTAISRCQEMGEVTSDDYYLVTQQLSEINGRNYRLNGRVEDVENQIMILSKESEENGRKIDLALRYIKVVHKKLKEGK